MLKASTLQLLRFPFSYFLMPVYFFSLSFVDHVDWFRAVLVFLLIHLLLYPSSNGYNSYMDRDTGSIGGIKDPLQPTRELFYVTVIMDILAGALSFFISAWFGLAFVFYIICSRLYSYRGIRLKQYPIIGYLTVIFNQGAVIFFMVAHGASIDLTTDVSYTGMLASSFLIGGFYPITQIYQHQQDKEDGVKTISMLLGKRGTFFFCAIMYTMAFGLLFMDYMNNSALNDFLVLQAFFIPVIIFFLRWFIMVWKDESKADFKHTMQMNWLAGTCTNLAFITIITIHQLG